MTRWLGRDSRTSPISSSGLWDGAYPEGNIQDVSELYDLVNQQPFGELEIEDSR